MMRRRIFVTRGSQALLIFLAYSLIFPVHIFALPQGGQVAAGSAQISQPNAQNMHINQATNRAIINWQSFGISYNEAVQFFQPGSTSISLNRVIGVDPSLIYGNLSANGRIFLINPNGILVGPSGVIDVNSFVASTLDIPDDDFMSGTFSFSQTLGQSLAAVVNQGSIHAAEDGFVSLIAPGVQNQGTIVANLGKVYLGGGEHVTLNFAGNDLISFAVDEAVQGQVYGPDGEVLEQTIYNSGEISVSYTHLRAHET